MENNDIDTRRSFYGPDEETQYFIANPNAEDIRGADWQYSKTYTRCLNEGITTSAEMMDILRRRGVVGGDYDKRAEELSTRLNDLIIRLGEAKTNEEKSSLAVEVAQAREALFQWNQRMSGPMSNTCEQIADDARLEYLTSCMVQYEDGTRVWKDHDDFLASNDQALTMKSRYEIMLFLQGYDSNFLDNTPESLAMKEVEEDIIKQASAVEESEDKSEKTKTSTKKKSGAKKSTKKTKDEEKDTDNK